jgi:regulator of nonsense transcripts 2
MYRVISTPIIYETLWLLISYGHSEPICCTIPLKSNLLHRSDDGLPVPGRSSPVDAADDFFRVRLVCTLLDSCGTCFDKGSNRKKLDHFLTVFQVRDVDQTACHGLLMKWEYAVLALRSVQDGTAN